MSDIDTLARTILGEASDQYVVGMAAVACVVMNRVNADLHNDNKPDWWGEGVEAVCKKPWQFSCWNDGDPNALRIGLANLGTPMFREAIAIASLAVQGWLADLTLGATHYHVAGLHPAWIKGATVSASIGDHVFYKDVP